MGMDARNLEVGSNHIICLHHQVLLLVAIYGIVRNLQVTRHLAWKFIAHQLDFQGVGKRDRIEHCFQVVVAVSPLAYYV